jgi:hypothetical protein
LWKLLDKSELPWRKSGKGAFLRKEEGESKPKPLVLVVASIHVSVVFIGPLTAPSWYQYNKHPLLNTITFGWSLSRSQVNFWVMPARIQPSTSNDAFSFHAGLVLVQPVMARSSLRIGALSPTRWSFEYSWSLLCLYACNNVTRFAGFFRGMSSHQEVMQTIRIFVRGVSTGYAEDPVIYIDTMNEYIPEAVYKQSSPP